MALCHVATYIVRQYNSMTAVRSIITDAAFRYTLQLSLVCVRGSLSEVDPVVWENPMYTGRAVIGGQF